MIKGFFNLSDLSSARTIPTIPRCGLCKLYSSCQFPKMSPTGKGKRGVLICGESPGNTEDKRGVQFIGESGQILRKLLRSINVDLDRDCWKTNALCCHPAGNKLPKNAQTLIDACRPNLMNTIKKYQPHTIILVGATACKSLIPVIWKDKVEEFSKWTGQNIPSQFLNAWVCPVYHPAYLLRQKNTLLETITRKSLKKAFSHKARPWQEVPDYKSEVEVIHRPYMAAKAIRDMIQIGQECSLDIETNTLKPEEVGAEIICCSICQSGRRTIAYPWIGETIDATIDLLKSEIPKVGANIKFEDRWFRRLYGFGVKNWMWDAVICAHYLDNRSGITSVKFQSFVQLGLKSYNEQVEPYLKPAKNKRLNRIKELPINDILIYNGIDSLVEWKIYEIQKKKLERMRIHA